MASGTAALQDTRGEINYLGKIGSAIKNRTKAAAQMARKERAFAEEQAEKGDTSLDEAGIGRGYFFKRALGSTFGGDKIARTRGYFEKNPPAGRDPTGTRESRFRGGFDYDVSVTPLEPIIPPPKPISPFELEQTRKKLTMENMLRKPSTVATEDSEATPVIDKTLNEKVAAALGGIELQLTRLSGKLEGDKNNTNAVAGLVSKNSQILVKGFDSMVAAMSAFKDSVQQQTKSKENIAREEEQTAEKLADRQSVEEEQLQQEQIDGEAGNADVLGGEGGEKKKGGGLGLPNFLGMGKFGRGLKFLANPKVLAVLAAVAAGAGLSAFLGKFIGKPRVEAEAERMETNVEAGGNPNFRPRDAGGSGSLNDYQMVPGAYTGGTTTKETLLRVSEGNSKERITPMNKNTYMMQAQAQYEVMKKRRNDYALIQSRGLQEYFDNRNGWQTFVDVIKEFFDGFNIGDIFGGGDRRTLSTSGDGKGAGIAEGSDAATLATIAALESGSAQGQADVAQSVYNRLADGTYGDSITDVLTRDGQYQPAFIDPTASSGPGTKVADVFKNITDEDSAVKAIQYYYRGRGMSISEEAARKKFRDASRAISDPELQRKAAEHVGGRTEFLSSGSDTSRESNVAFRGSSSDNRYFSAYGSGNQMSRGAVPVPEGLFKKSSRESRFAEYQLEGNTPHTIVRSGDVYHRVNEIGAIGGDPMTLETAETLINKQTGEVMPMYRLQYKPGEDQIDKNLLNPGTLPYIPPTPKGDEQVSPGPNASAQVAPLSTEVAMSRDRARSQPAVINLPIPGSQDGAVPKQDTVQHAPASLVPDWLHTTAT